MSNTTKGKKGETEAIDAMAQASQQAFENAVKSGTENYEKAFASARKQIDEAIRNYDDVAAFGKDNFEAAVAAGNAYAKGVEALSSEVLAFQKQSLESGVATAKALFTAKTVQEAMDIQAGFAKSYMESLLNQSSKLGELSTKVAQQTADPLQSRFNAAVQKWTNTVA